MKKFYLLVLSLLTLVSCESQKLPPEVVESLVTIHSIDNTGMKTKLLTPIVVDGRTIYVNKIPLLTNHDMMGCEIFQYREEEYGLEFLLTDKGRISWQQEAVSHKGTTGVLVIGGQFKCFMKFGRQIGGYNVKIAAPLTKEEAEEISKNITRNYIAIKERS
ncbi:MAG: hypothetical protein MK132_12670 [Lentisphaerales bacterium]|nr:hypothetical protein [Lentisphaerales bacterium]